MTSEQVEHPVETHHDQLVYRYQGGVGWGEKLTHP